jgi:hypothetical protein
MTTCQCQAPVITLGGTDKATPFCKTCLLRIEIKPVYEPDPARKVWVRKATHGTA